MSDHDQYFLLCSKAVYPVPVGENVRLRMNYLGRAKIVNDAVKEQLNRKSIKYNWHEADVTVLEGIFARGDRKVGQAILKAYENGCIFDAWSEFFDNNRWIETFKEIGMDPDFYTMRERTVG